MSYTPAHRWLPAHSLSGMMHTPTSYKHVRMLMDAHVQPDHSAVHLRITHTCTCARMHSLRAVSSNPHHTRVHTDKHMQLDNIANTSAWTRVHSLMAISHTPPSYTHVHAHGQVKAA
eukprot:1161233-Pelagomonas_calceolata.AAC.10